MNNRTIDIGELHLRATGLSREDGQRLGTAVAHRLAALATKSGPARGIQRMSVQVRPPTGASASVDRLADAIVAHIRRKLG